MELLKSIRFFLWGIIKRVYWILPTLILDPFDLLERLFNVNYQVPQWSIWSLFSLGWFIAMVLTFHELRMNKISSSDDVDNGKVIYSKLSNEARTLLRRASFPEGTIMYGQTMGGTFIQVDRMNIIANPKDSREVAKWESAFSELEKYKLINDTYGKGEIFSVTHLGYKVADEIKKRKS